tara:strand:+ start:304 stop:885 length:582 start_codon:yes stop_codon:yes gene_type:complete
MTTWWQSLPTDLQIFYGIGSIALLFTVVQMLLTLIGLGGEAVDLDLEFDGPDTQHSSGIGLFSTQTISAFLLGFGWVGGLTRASGMGLALTVVVAFVVGVALMFLMVYMLRGLLRLQSKGNLDYSSAIGEEAVVYVTIPGSNNDEGGQIQVMIQGRLKTASARKASAGALKPGDKVKIVAVTNASTFVVEGLT